MIRRGLAALSEMRAVTRDLPDLRVLVVSGILGTLGAGLLNPILPGYLTSAGLDVARIGLVFTVGSLVPMFVQPALGALSDRLSRKRLLIGMSVTTSLMIPLLALLRGPLPLAVALATKLMIDRSASPIAAALVGDLAPTERRATVFGLLSSAVNLVFVVALLASAAATGLLHEEGVFFLAGASFLVSSLALIALRDPVRGAPDAARAASSSARVALAGLLSPLRYVRRSREARALFGYQLCFTFALDLYPVYLPLFAAKLGARQAMVGPLIASSWFVYALVQPVGGRLSDGAPRRKGLITLGLAGMAAAALLLGLSGFAAPALALPLLTAAWVLMAIPDGLLRPAADALALDLAPAAERGQFFGALGSASALANVTAPLVYGLVARSFGLEAAFIASAFALLAGLLFIARVNEPAARASAPAAATSEVS